MTRQLVNSRVTYLHDDKRREQILLKESFFFHDLVSECAG